MNVSISPVHRKADRNVKLSFKLNQESVVNSLESIEESLQNIEEKPAIEAFIEHHKKCQEYIGLKDEDIKCLTNLVKKGIELYQLRQDL
jgi:pantoate kinase